MVILSSLTCGMVRNFLSIGVGADQASGGWLSCTVYAVGAVDDHEGEDVSTVGDGEIITLLSYCKENLKILL